MFTERRKTRRTRPIKQPKGKLVIHSNDLEQRVNAIQDVSPYGICVLVKQVMDKGTDIVLTYQDESLHLKLFGAVAWSSPIEATLQPSQTDPLYRIGIALQQEHMQQNTLLFGALLDSE